MTDVSPIRFTLSDGTEVTIKKVKNDKYDFQLKLTNGSRKTFVWMTDGTNDFSDRKGIKDVLIVETLEQFSNMND